MEGLKTEPCSVPPGRRTRSLQAAPPTANCLGSTESGSEICEQRGSPVHGMTHIKLQRSSGIAVVYTCEPGYHLKGTTLAVCVHGVWTHPLPSCNHATIGPDSSGVIVSMSELDSLPSSVEIQNLEEDKLRHNHRNQRKRKRKHKGKRKNRKIVDTSGDRTMKLKSVPDMSCLLGSVSVPGFVRAPTILNALTPKYLRRKSNKGRHLVAVYTCTEGYTLKNQKERILACSKNRWVGRRPSCISIREHGQSRSTCDTAGCEHDCKIVKDQPQCFCFKGFKFYGTSCIDIDECQEGNGGCAEQCHNTPGSFYCKCEEGFRVAYDRRSCEDINECLLRNGHGPCQGECINTEGSYFCSCNAIPGTKLSKDNHSCEDIDECKDELYSLGCSHSCINTIGTAFCHCPEGYLLDLNWKTCIDINECDFEECSQGCVNTEGSYYCVCEIGYNLAEDRKTCQDINECSDEFLCSHECINIAGSYNCKCPTNYKLASDQRTCNPPEDNYLFTIGENTKICSNNSINSLGIYKCECPPGFILADDARTCEDNDECLDNNEVSNRCTHLCINNIGSYHCECPEGYVLEKEVCKEVNNCELLHGDCLQVCIDEIPVHCTNLSKFHTNKNNLICFEESCRINCTQIWNDLNCSCKEGFTFEHDLKTCKYINECFHNNGNCSQQCVNEEQSYYCKCSVGYVLDNDSITCHDINECDDKNGGCSQVCTNTDGAFACSCNRGFKLQADFECVDIDECNTNDVDKHCAEYVENKCSQICVNTVGSFYCTCKNDFTSSSTNTSGFISCDDGYIFNNKSEACVDVDECLEKTANCSNNCENTVGSYICLLESEGITEPCKANDRPVCDPGFVLSHNNKCEDVNECLNSNACDHECKNTPGSYECICKDGFKKNKNKCIDMTRPFIRCPKEIRHTLQKGQSAILVKIAHPKTNMDWERNVISKPAWGKDLEAILPVGKTRVLYNATNPNNGLFSTCTLTIHIIDAEKPEVKDCPNNILFWLKLGTNTQKVIWTEPSFKDNVKIAHLYSSKVPGQEFEAGVHKVSYVVVDNSGNIATCQFTVTIKGVL